MHPYPRVIFHVGESKSTGRFFYQQSADEVLRLRGDVGRIGDVDLADLFIRLVVTLSLERGAANLRAKHSKL